MTNTARKGTRVERELSNRLEDEWGWYAQRTGASGGATDRARPDVIACRRLGSEHTPPSYVRTDAALIEVKAWKRGTGQLDGEEIDALVEAAGRAGATPLLVVKPDLRRHNQWHVFDVAELNETPSGNYSVRQCDLPGRSLVEVFG